MALSIVRPKDNTGQELIDSAQTATGSWVNLGDLIDVRDVSKVGIWFKYTINDSVNLRFRVIAKLTESESDTSIYSLPIHNVSASVVLLEDEYFEFNEDTDQNMVIESEVADIVPYIQFQVMVGTVGATAATVDSAKLTFNTLDRRFR